MKDSIMTEFYIEYNPYKLECIFKANGKELSKESKFNSVKNQRLQFFLEKNSSWGGLTKEIEKLTNDNDVHIMFKGRKIDYEDLKFYIDRYKGNTKFTICYIQAKNDSDVLKEIDKIVFNFKKGPIEELKDNKVIEEYERVKNSKFIISIIANMSNGKSTLVNALIGTDLLPSCNKACTATVARITNTDNADCYTAACLDDNENTIYQRKKVTLDDIEKYNNDEKVTFIDIECKIPAISSKKMKLLLQDTPGNNNSMNENHGKLTEKIIKDRNKSVVLYVLNAANQASDDDKTLLKMVSNAMKNGDKQSKDRFIFVINKCDELDTEKGETVEKLLEDVKEYLNGFGIYEPNLFPVSAEAAKIIRKSKAGEKVTKKEKTIVSCFEHSDGEEDLLKLEKFASLSPSGRVNIEKRLKKAIEDHDEKEQELIHTGIPALEEVINEYLEKYAYPIKINDAIKHFNEIIQEKDMLANFCKAITSDENILKNVKQQLKMVRKKFENNKKTVEQTKETINNFCFEQKDKKEEQENNFEKELMALVKPYNGKTQVEETEAEKILTNSFMERIKNIQEEYENKLSKIVEEEVVNEGQKMLDEYREYITQLKENIHIDNFDFGKVVAFKKHETISSENLEDLIEKNKSKEDIFETQKVTNPKKRWWKIFVPKYIKKNVKVGEKEYVNVEEVVRLLLGKMVIEMKENIDKTYENAEKRLNEFKEYFIKQIDELEQIVSDEFKEIENLTADRNKINEKVKDNDEKLKWLKNIIKSLNNIMNFEE